MRAAPLTLVERARGAMLGALAGGGDAALLEVLAEELAAGRTDLRRLAERWVERSPGEPVALEPETAAALAFIAAHGAPPVTGGEGDGALARAVPVALVAHRAPRTLVSATYRIVALTHPAPEAAWGAVAVNVALARFLDGKRDFLADVVEVLAANGAPERLLAAVRQVPLRRREALPSPEAARIDAVAGVELALGLAQHEPLAARGLELARRHGASCTAAAAGALFGARDGVEALPDHWPPDPRAALWVDLADRLLRLTPAPV